jgi:hypothetical protein
VPSLLTVFNIFGSVTIGSVNNKWDEEYMMSHQLPTDYQIRKYIDSIRDEKYRMAFRFQYLIAGRISEVCGKYAPLKTDAVEVDFDGVAAVLFVVKTAKRKGKLRACAVPLDETYEPWARPVYEYFQNCSSEYPFMFHENRSHSVRYAQWVAQRAFNGLEWPMKEYSRPIEVEIKPDQIIREGINQRNQEVYLIEQKDGMRKWFTKIRENVVRDHYPVYERWKPFRSHGLRKRRNITVKFFYLFDGFDRAAYGGWTEKSRVESMPEAESHYISDRWRLMRSCSSRWLQSTSISS